MIKAYSKRLLSPFYGQAQLAESERARAITVDGVNWEIHFLFGSGIDAKPGERAVKRFRRVADIDHDVLVGLPHRDPGELGDVDERILELAVFIASAELPFPAMDRYEYWLLDREDGAPLALIFSCTDAEEMDTYPVRPEWTALPAAVLPIEPTAVETARCDSPVNYQLESLVSRRAGTNPRAQWYERRAGDEDDFPPYMVREDWQDEADSLLCQRYLQRQSTRLLMLHGLKHEDRLRMEQAARAYCAEVERFFALYPAVADSKLMNAIRVEARLRQSEDSGGELKDRRDGVYYL